MIEYLGRIIDEEVADVPVSSRDTTEAGHGRQEERLVLAVPVPEDFGPRESWPGLASLCLVTRARESNGRFEGPEAFYYISSLAADAEKLGAAIRGHWSLENKLTAQEVQHFLARAEPPGRLKQDRPEVVTSQHESLSQSLQRCRCQRTELSDGFDDGDAQ